MSGVAYRLHGETGSSVAVQMVNKIPHAKF